MKPSSHSHFPAFQSWIAGVIAQIMKIYDCSQEDANFIVEFHDHYVNYTWSSDFSPVKAGNYIASKVHYGVSI